MAATAARAAAAAAYPISPFSSLSSPLLSLPHIIKLASGSDKTSSLLCKTDRTHRVALPSIVRYFMIILAYFVDAILPMKLHRKIQCLFYVSG